MSKSKKQFGLKKPAWYCYGAFNSLVISASQKRKTKMQLKCMTMNRYFLLFCGLANMLISRENMGPEGWYVCCGGVIPI